MRRLLLLLSLLACAVSCTWQNAESSIVSVRNGQFIKNNEPYYFIGTNLWYGPILASEGSGGNRERLCAELDSLKELGISNLRVLAGGQGDKLLPCKIQPLMETAPGVFNDTLLRGLDYFLYELGKRDMEAVIYFNNSWEWSGGYSQYLTWAGFGEAPIPRIDGYNTFVSYVNNYMKSDSARSMVDNYIKTVVSRVNTITGKPYSEDPAIFSWQICNEPRCFGKENKEAFARWIDHCATLIKSIDPNHMVSIGSEGKYGCEVDIDLWRRLGELENIDYFNIHIWPFNWGWSSRDDLEGTLDRGIELSLKYFNEHKEIAAQVGKPLTLEEFGFPRNGVEFSPEVSVSLRDRYYKVMFDQIISEAENDGIVAGCNFWAWGGTAVAAHLMWEPGDDYMGDPAQEEQGLYSVFLSDKSTISVIDNATERLESVRKNKKK